MRPTNDRGKIFVLWAEGTDLVNIGYTERRIGDHCSEIEKECSWPLRVVSVFYGTPTELAEIHARFRPYWTIGDWFDLPEEHEWWLLSKSLQWPGTPELLIEFTTL